MDSDHTSDIDQLRSQLEAQQEQIQSQEEKLQGALIRQEHRPILIVKNLVKFWKNDKEDTRRKNAVNAFIWWLISPRTVATAGISIIAVVGLWVAWKANGLLDQQNTLLSTQNEKLEIQNDKIDKSLYLMEADRRASLNFELSTIYDEIDEELDEWREDHPDDPIADTLSGQLVGRIVAISHAFQPYRRLREDGTLDSVAMSPERGQLFRALAGLPIDTIQFLSEANLKFADIGKVNWPKAPLREVDFIGANLNNANFFGANAERVNFNRACLEGINLMEANLRGSTFIGTDAKRGKFDKSQLAYVGISRANFRGAKFNYSNLLLARIVNSDFSQINGFGINLTQSFIRNGSFLNSDMTGANLSSASIIKSDFRNVILYNSKMNDVHLNGTRLFTFWKELFLDYGLDSNQLEKAIWEDYRYIHTKPPPSTDSEGKEQNNN